MAYGNFRKTEIIEEIGSELKKARKAKKYTLGDLSQQLSAQGMNLSPALLSRMENGERRIDDDTLEAVCVIICSSVLQCFRNCSLQIQTVKIKGV